MAVDLERQARYLAKVDRRGGGECWPWMAFRNPAGYGMFRAADGVRLAHRWGYEQFVGPVGSLHVCHTCDNPACQNPQHWFLGTPADNCADKVRKGRQARVSRPGVANPGAKLTEETVAEIRESYLAGRDTQRGLAARYNVSRTQVGRIVAGLQWGGKPIDGSKRRASGERNGQAKLTDSERQAILATYARGNITQSELAAAFGVSQPAISAVLRSQKTSAPRDS